MFVGMSLEIWGVSLARGQRNSLAKRFAWGVDLGLEETVCGALPSLLYLCNLEE